MRWEDTEADVGQRVGVFSRLMDEDCRSSSFFVGFYHAVACDDDLLNDSVPWEHGVHDTDGVGDHRFGAQVAFVLDMGHSVAPRVEGDKEHVTSCAFSLDELPNNGTPRQRTVSSAVEEHHRRLALASVTFRGARMDREANEKVNSSKTRASIVKSEVHNVRYVSSPFFPASRRSSHQKSSNETIRPLHLPSHPQPPETPHSNSTA